MRMSAVPGSFSLMDEQDLTRRASRRALELPGSVLEHPFGADWDVYKVRGKVFLLLTQVTGEHLVTVKSDPSDSEALRREFPSISPGYHMNKRHWISLRAGADLDAPLVEDLVTESYLLIVETLARAARPVDPRTFAEQVAARRRAEGGADRG